MCPASCCSPERGQESKPGKWETGLKMASADKALWWQETVSLQSQGGYVCVCLYLHASHEEAGGVPWNQQQKMACKLRTVLGKVWNAYHPAAQQPCRPGTCREFWPFPIVHWPATMTRKVAPRLKCCICLPVRPGFWVTHCGLPSFYFF